MAQTNRQTSGHCDSMTESAQWGRYNIKASFQMVYMDKPLKRDDPLALTLIFFNII